MRGEQAGRIEQLNQCLVVLISFVPMKMNEVCNPIGAKNGTRLAYSIIKSLLFEQPWFNRDGEFQRFAAC